MSMGLKEVKDTRESPGNGTRGHNIGISQTKQLHASLIGKSISSRCGEYLLEAVSPNNGKGLIECPANAKSVNKGKNSLYSYVDYYGLIYFNYMEDNTLQITGTKTL